MTLLSGGKHDRRAGQSRKPRRPDVRFYRSVLDVLRQSGPPFLVGGAYALARYTGVVRHTKDLDLFVRPSDAGRALEALAAAGWRTEITFTHWLGKAFGGEDFIDVIYSSGNGLCPVDDAWFTHAVESEVLGGTARLCPPEEIIWQKAFIQERQRFDGADVAHLIRACGQTMDWPRLLGRFGSHWPVLFGHLMLFRYIYPSETHCIPAAVLRELTARLADGDGRPARGRCALPRRPAVALAVPAGPGARRLLRRASAPRGNMTAEQIKAWTDAAFQH